MGLRAGLLPLRPPRRPSPTLAAPLQLASTSFRSPTPSPHLKTQLDHEQPVEPAQLGELHKLPALSSRERVTDFADLIDQILAGVTKILSILENRTPPPSTSAHPHNLPPWMPPAYFIGRDKELRA